MKKYRMNFDYESYLFAHDFQKIKNKFNRMNKEMEYIYFFMQKESSEFFSYNEYETDYLDYLKSLGCQIPKFIKDERDVLNFWGKGENLEIERKLNSKLTSTEIALENNWSPKSVKIIQNLEEFKSHLRQFESNSWILRYPYEMSGRKIIKYFKGDDLSKIEKALRESKLILSPYFKRFLDIGITYEIEKNSIIDSFWIQNLIDNNCAFKGGRCGKGLKEILEKKYEISLDDSLLQSREIAEHYVDIGADERVQIDSFFYHEDMIHYYPLVEVNYRKTMGSFLRAIEKNLYDNNIARFCIFPFKKMKKFNNYSELLSIISKLLSNDFKATGIIPISPLKNHFFSLIIISKNLEEEKELIDKTWSLIGADREIPHELSIGF